MSGKVFLGGWSQTPRWRHEHGPRSPSRLGASDGRASCRSLRRRSKPSVVPQTVGVCSRMRRRKRGRDASTPPRLIEGRALDRRTFLFMCAAASLSGCSLAKTKPEKWDELNQREFLEFELFRPEDGFS